jgi:putative transposase
MLRNHTLAQAICDASWSQLRRQLEYKADWYGRSVIATDRWYPSSRTCSGTGAIVEKLPLDIREWACRCGTVHDRDINAAKVILAAGLAVAACGDGVRPART